MNCFVFHSPQLTACSWFCRSFNIPCGYCSNSSIIANGTFCHLQIRENCCDHFCGGSAFLYWFCFSGPSRNMYLCVPVLLKLLVIEKNILNTNYIQITYKKQSLLSTEWLVVIKCKKFFFFIFKCSNYRTTSRILCTSDQVLLLVEHPCFLSVFTQTFV